MNDLHRHHDSTHAGNEIVRTFDDALAHDVLIHDETLRDGEQTPGVGFTRSQKCELASGLIDAGVRHLTIGFPGASIDELGTVAELVRVIDGKADVWCISRTRVEDMTAVLRAGVQNVAIFFPGSSIHLQSKMRITLDEANRIVGETITAAVRLGLRVRFAIEDASRSPLENIMRLASSAVNAGACMLTLPDTCGVLTPIATQRLFAHMRKHFTDISLVAHCHNDLGLGVANSICAALGGASVLQGSLGGLGERAGNAPTEELAAILALKFERLNGISLEKLCLLATRATQLARFPLAPNKPLLGTNVFAHESGVHVHGLMRDLACYEPFPPELVGRSHEVRYGKHSGISNLRFLLDKYNIQCPDGELRDLLSAIRNRAEQSVTLYEIDVLHELRRLQARPN